MKLIFVVLDGLGDRSCSRLKGKTPLEAAFIPALDKLASVGRTGLVHVIKPGVAPESDTAVMALLGYSPYTYYTGRGPLEAYGAGLKLTEGDLALRANFATIKKNIVVDRRAGRTLTTAQAIALAKTINSKVEVGFPFLFKPTIQHRGVLIIRGSFSDNITNTDPGYERWGVARKKIGNKLRVSQPLDEEEDSDLSADLNNSFVWQSSKILANHPINMTRQKKGLLPANVIITRDAGIRLPDFPKKPEKWLAVVGMPLEIALARLAGMSVFKFEYPPMTGPDVYSHLRKTMASSIVASLEAIQKNWRRYDCFYLHIKETDVPGHDGLPTEKVAMIETIDKKLIKPLSRYSNRSIICVTADHSTPCSLKVHSSDPVPLLVSGKGKDGSTSFDERSCAKGSIKLQGTALLKFLLK